MKKNKFNWSLIVMVLIILVMTIIGIVLMENYWIESASAAIWIAGMVMIALAMCDKMALDFVRKMTNIDNYMDEDAE